MLKTIFKLGFAAFTSSILLTTQAEAQCGRGFCSPDDDSDNNRIWVEAEYLYWQIEASSKVIPLVNSGVFYNPPLGAPNSAVVLGDKKIHQGWRSGAKFSVGYWLDDERYLGVEANYFLLPGNSRGRSVSSSGLPGSPFLSVPFFDVTSSEESSMAVSSSFLLPEGGPFSGTASYKLGNDLQGAELNGLLVCHEDCEWKLGLLAGFRYLNFDEKFSFTTNSPYLNSDEDIFVTKDKFATQNNFYGGQVGLDFDYARSGFFFDLQGKIAFGVTNGEVDIHGKLLTNDFITPASEGDPLLYSGGVFALPSNIGDHKKTFFTYVPEVNVNVGYQVIDCLRLKIGYSFLYVSNVLRAPKQLSRNITPNQSAAILFSSAVAVSDTDRPTGSKRTESLWIQGANIGLEFNF